MQRFYCSCGQEVFFDNTFCGVCGAQLGFDPTTLEVLPASSAGGKPPVWQHSGRALYACAQRGQPLACNWLVAVKGQRCLSCRTTRKKPAQSIPENLRRWYKVEHAKRRVIYSLLKLGLPVGPRAGSPRQGMVFDFVEDQRTNPQASPAMVYTGHADGVISVNVIEADDVQRAILQQQMNERYRTLVGHFRHEVGHYYWERLVKGTVWYPGFVELFGSEAGYRAALDRYYLYGVASGWQAEFLTAYASSHPWEDWAESWAHYLHMVDTLETAAVYGLEVTAPTPGCDFNQLIQDWMGLTLKMNALNRSMGLDDAYPFILPKPARDKLQFIHRLVGMPASSALAAVTPDAALP